MPAFSRGILARVSVRNSLVFVLTSTYLHRHLTHRGLNMLVVQKPSFSGKITPTVLFHYQECGNMSVQPAKTHLTITAGWRFDRIINQIPPLSFHHNDEHTADRSSAQPR